MRHKVRHTHKLPGMSVDVGLIPGASGIVLGLDDVSERNAAVFLHIVFEGSILVVVLGAELVLDGGEDGTP
mgnify:CR=1 FL=1